MEKRRSEIIIASLEKQNTERRGIIRKAPASFLQIAPGLTLAETSEDLVVVVGRSEGCSGCG